MGTDIVAAGPDQPIVRVPLQGMRCPARIPGECKYRREKIDCQPHREITRRGEEINVRVDSFTADGLLHDPLNRTAHDIEIVVSRFLRNVLCKGLQVFSPRIVSLVHPMPKARDFLLTIQTSTNEILDGFQRADCRDLF